MARWGMGDQVMFIRYQMFWRRNTAVSPPFFASATNCLCSGWLFSGSLPGVNQKVSLTLALSEAEVAVPLLVAVNAIVIAGFCGWTMIVVRLVSWMV